MGKSLLQRKQKIHVSDLAFLRGYGIFDFLRVISSKPVFIEGHLDRFENAAKLMGLPISENRRRLREIISELIQLNPHELLGVKLILTGGYSADGFSPSEKSNLLITTKPFTFSSPVLGLKLISYNIGGRFGKLKH